MVKSPFVTVNDHSAENQCNQSETVSTEQYRDSSQQNYSYQAQNNGISSSQASANPAMTPTSYNQYGNYQQLGLGQAFVGTSQPNYSYQVPNNAVIPQQQSISNVGQSIVQMGNANTSFSKAVNGNNPISPFTQSAPESDANIDSDKKQKMLDTLVHEYDKAVETANHMSKRNDDLTARNEKLSNENELARKQNSELITQVTQLSYKNDLTEKENLEQKKQLEMNRCTIARLTSKENKVPRTFSRDIYGRNYSIEPNGSKIMLGKFVVTVTFIVKSSYEYLYVKYKCETNDEYDTVIPIERFDKGNIYEFFGHFHYDSSISKQVINAFLKLMIGDTNNMSVVNIPKYAGFCDDNGILAYLVKESYDSTDLSKIIHENIRSRSHSLNCRPLNEIAEDMVRLLPLTLHFLILLAIRFLGLTASIMKKIVGGFPCIVNIEASDSGVLNFVSAVLQVYNRSKPHSYSLHETPARLRRLLRESKDEVLVFADSSVNRSEKRLAESIGIILENVTGTDEQPQDNISVIVSNNAPYIIPNEHLLYLIVPDSHYTSESLSRMALILEEFDAYLINWIIRNYSDFKLKIKTIYNNYMSKYYYRKDREVLSQIMTAAMFINCFYPLPVEDAETHLIKMLDMSAEFSDNGKLAIINDFADNLNKALRYGLLSMVEYGRDMKYSTKNNTIIRKGDTLYVEDSVLKDVIMQNMTSTNIPLHILNALDNQGILVKDKKNRCLLTVYNENGLSRRLPFVAFKYDGILDIDILEMLEGSGNNKYFMAVSPSDEFLSLVSLPDGRVAGMLAKYADAANQHISVTGMSGQGKTVFLSQLIYNKFCNGDKVIIFDTNDSFSRKEMVKNLSEEFVNNSVIFHNIEESGLPVDLFELSGYHKSVEKKNSIAGILAAPLNDLSDNQYMVLKNTVKEVVDGKFDMFAFMDGPLSIK